MRRLYRVDRDIQPPALLGREDVRDFSLNLSVEMVAESEEEVVETVLAHAKVTAADLTDIEAEPLTEVYQVRAVLSVVVDLEVESCPGVRRAYGGWARKILRQGISREALLRAVTAALPGDPDVEVEPFMLNGEYL